MADDSYSTESDPYSTAEDSGIQGIIMDPIIIIDETEEDETEEDETEENETEEEVGERYFVVPREQEALYNAIDDGDLARVTDIIRQHPLLLR